MKHILWHIAAFLLLALAACGHRSPTWQRLSDAEALMADHPDSALALIEAIDSSTLSGAKEKARYALLRSMALDKNYVDTTSFVILQPAISYYSRHGSPTDKLRTLYYQGRIYQNRGQADSAMTCFIRGKEYGKLSTDTLTLANLIVAQACLLDKEYIYEDDMELNLEASGLYHKIGRTDYEVSCLTGALPTLSSMGQEDRADSVATVLDELLSSNEEFAPMAEPSLLIYCIKFGSPDDVREAISGYEAEDITNDDMLIDLANAYCKLGDADNALRFLQATSPVAKQSLKYKSSLPDILALNGKPAEAFRALRDCCSEMDSINNEIIYSDILFLNTLHEQEKASLIELRAKDRIIGACIGVCLLLIIIAIAVYYRYRLNLAQRLLKEHENEKLLLERENLEHRLRALESESEALKTVIDTHTDLSAPLSAAIKERIEMLNTVLASIISGNNKHKETYETWAKKLTDNALEFMDANRLAFQASHPLFIRHFQEHGLTEDEINYVCLYALGLSGKEIGVYMKKPGHTNLSSEIRLKLDLDKHATNLSVYVRRILAQE